MEEDTPSPPKRQRLDESSRDASPEEPHFRPRRESLVIRSRSRVPDLNRDESTVEENYESRERAYRRRSRSESESRSRSRRRRPSSGSSADDDDDDRDSASSQRGYTRDKSEELDEKSGLTPIGRPETPPPKPTQLYYRQKLLLRGHRRAVSAVKFSPDGGLIASCSADGTIKIWDAPTGRLLHTLEGHLAGINTIAWSSDSRTIASGSDDKSIRLWDVPTGKPHPTPLIGHHNYVYSIAYSPKGNMIVSGSYDEAVFLWDVRSARVMRALPAHSDPVAGCDFVRDGTLIASCAGDGLIRIWDTANGQCLKTMVDEDRRAVTCVRFSPNGKFVLAWTLDSSIRLWEYVTGKKMKTYQGHENFKYSLQGTFGSYAGGTESFVISGSEDGSILAWDVPSKSEMMRLHGHRGAVMGVDTFTQDDGQGLIVSGGLDKTIRIWEEVPSTNGEAKNGEVSNGIVDATNGLERDELMDQVEDILAAEP